MTLVDPLHQSSNYFKTFGNFSKCWKTFLNYCFQTSDANSIDTEKSIVISPLSFDKISPFSLLKCHTAPLWIVFNVFFGPIWFYSSNRCLKSNSRYRPSPSASSSLSIEVPLSNHQNLHFHGFESSLCSKDNFIRRRMSLKLLIWYRACAARHQLSTLESGVLFVACGVYHSIFTVLEQMLLIVIVSSAVDDRIIRVAIYSNIFLEILLMGWLVTRVMPSQKLRVTKVYIF